MYESEGVKHRERIYLFSLLLAAAGEKLVNITVKFVIFCLVEDNQDQSEYSTGKI